jgi:hypothetical protein
MESKGMSRWAVRIIEHDGKGHLLCEAGGGGVAAYASSQRAEEIAEAMRHGLGNDVQNVSVARYAGEMCGGRCRLEPGGQYEPIPASATPLVDRRVES